MTSRLAMCCAFAFLLPAAVSAQAVDAPGERLTLAAAVRMAVDHNRAIEAARLQEQKAADDLAASRTRRLPSFETTVQSSELLTPVNFSFPRGAFGDIPGVGPIPDTDTNVSTPRQVNVFISSQVAQPITQLHRIGLSIKNAGVSRELERERIRDQQLAIVNSVKRLYFSILQTESAIEVSNEAISLYKELNRTLENRVMQKVALRSDSLDVQARLAQEEYTRLTRVNALATQKEQLNQLLGRDVRIVFVTEAAAAISPIDVDLAAAQSRALAERPDVRQARLKLQQAELDRRAKKAERIPDVTVIGSYVSNFNIDILPRNLASAGVQVKWEPFDWGRKGHELAAKDRVAEQARLSVRDTEDRAIVEINSYFRKLGEARALLNVAEMAQRTAREKLRVATNQYQIQAVLLSDVLNVRASLADTNDRYQQALLAFWTAKADFERAAGEDVVIP